MKPVRLFLRFDVKSELMRLRGGHHPALKKHRREIARFTY
jgi:hypothetical protein